MIIKYFLKMDIDKYFYSVRLDILLEQIQRHVQDEKVLYYVKMILNSYHDELFNKDVDVLKGMPIGNVTSQLFANIYLHDLDFYVEHTLKPKYRTFGIDLFYVRYVDDFVFLCDNKNVLLEIRNVVLEFLHKKLDLHISNHKIILNSVENGIPFLGYVILPLKKTYNISIMNNINCFHFVSHFKKVNKLLKVKNETIKRFKQKVKKKNYEDTVNALISFKGHCDLCNPFLIKKLCTKLLQNKVTNSYKFKNRPAFYEQKSGTEIRNRNQEQKSGTEIRNRNQEQKSGKMAKNRIFKFSCLFTLLSFNSRRYKKCISPVVATALLLVVAVVAVVGFQGWFGTYSTNILSGVESSSVNDVRTSQIETIVGNSLYLKNDYDNLTIKDIKVNGYSCFDSETNYSKGVLEINITDCILNLNTNTPDVVVVTDKGLIEKKIYVKSVNTTETGSGGLPPVVDLSCSLNGTTIDNGSSHVFYLYDKPYNNLAGCSAISQERTCFGGTLDGTNNYSYSTCNDSLAPMQGGEWVLVFANEDLGVNNDFYIMKYEAKFTNTVSKTQDATYNGWQYAGAGGDLSIRSHPTPEPITHITQPQAISSCASLGTGYKLITRAEWVTVAREAENNTYNWNSSEIYSESMYKGHSDNSPSFSLSVTDINDGYTGTLNSGTSNQRRIVKLYNGEIIWDLSGNVHEWNSDVYNTNAESSLGQSSSNYYEWTNIDTSYNYFKPYNTSLTSSNGIGTVYASVGNAIPSGTVHAFRSGGAWSLGVEVGIFSLILNSAPSGSGFSIGFRCSYNP